MIIYRSLFDLLRFTTMFLLQSKVPLDNNKYNIAAMDIDMFVLLPTNKNNKTMCTVECEKTRMVIQNQSWKIRQTWHIYQ